MTQAVEQAPTASTGPVDKFEARRGELADATLQTLGELGFARTSLREIAQKTAVLARRAALLLPRQGRADHLLRAALQGALRHPLRRDRRARRRPPRSSARASPTPSSDPARGHRDAPPLVRHARPGDVRGGLRPTSSTSTRQLEEMIWRVVQPLRRARRHDARRRPRSRPTPSSTGCSSTPCCATSPATPGRATGCVTTPTGCSACSWATRGGRRRPRRRHGAVRHTAEQLALRRDGRAGRAGGPRRRGHRPRRRSAGLRGYVYGDSTCGQRALYGSA